MHIYRAPNVYFGDDDVVNLESELKRSRRITCFFCGVKGAALGCYEMSCRKSFHVPCAKLTPECRWDSVRLNFNHPELYFIKDSTPLTPFSLL